MTDTTIADTTQEVTDATQEAVKQVNQLTQYVQDSIPGLITFGLKVLAALVAFFIGRLVIRWIRKIVRRSFERSGADKGVEQFVDSLLKYGLYALLVFSLISSLGFDTTSVAAVLASGGVAIGLALQGSLSNFAGGVLILLLKPFVVGDYIIEDTNGKEGTVKEIQIFYTKLSTIDNKTIVIPNGMLTNNSITNATAKDERQLDLRVSISYDADIRQAKNVIEELLEKDECIIKNEQINVFVHELADNAVVLGIRAWVKNEEYWTTRWRLLEEIKILLDENVASDQDTLALGIQTGDIIAMDPRTVVTESGYIKSRFLDDKLSAAILLGLARAVREDAWKLNRKVSLLFTVYEEVGHGGSVVPDDTEEMISVDMGCVGSDLGCTERMVSICAKDSGGPYNYDLITALSNLAKEKKLDYAIDVYPHYSSDVETTLRAGYDIRHGLIGPGVYASHNYERSHMDGVHNTFELLKAYITR